MKHIDPEKSVVLVTHDLSETGGPILTRKIAECLKGRGYYVVLVSLRKRGRDTGFRPYCDELLYADKTYDLLGKALRHTGHSVANRQSKILNKVVSRLARRGFRYVVLNTVVSGIAVPAFRKYDFRIVSLIHEMRGACKLFHAEDIIQNIAQMADVIVFPSELAKHDFCSFAEKLSAKTVIQPQGYYHSFFPEDDHEEARKDLCKQLGLPEQTRFMVGAGTICFHKGNDLLPLVAHETRSVENLHFLWLGSPADDAFCAHFEAMAERLDVANRIHYLGYVRDEKAYARILCGCDAFLLLSREDTFPSVMMEAAAAHLPIVAFDGCGGAHDFLSEEHGYLIPYMNIEGFSRTALGIATGQMSTERVCRRAFERVKKDFVFENYVEIITRELFGE